MWSSPPPRRLLGALLTSGLTSPGRCFTPTLPLSAASRPVTSSRLSPLRCPALHAAPGRAVSTSISTITTTTTTAPNTTTTAISTSAATAAEAPLPSASLSDASLASTLRTSAPSMSPPSGSSTGLRPGSWAPGPPVDLLAPRTPQFPSVPRCRVVAPVQCTLFSFSFAFRVHSSRCLWPAELPVVSAANRMCSPFQSPVSTRAPISRARPPVALSSAALPDLHHPLQPVSLPGPGGPRLPPDAPFDLPPTSCRPVPRARGF
ncbi:hypothetical protein V8E36_004380 [Tilletia maclaganii]